VNQQGVDLVIGYISSGDCLAIAPVAEEMKKLTVFFDCGTPRIFEDGAYKYVFRTGPTATMDAVAAAMYLKDQKVKVNTYAGINQNYAWGQDSWADFTGAMKEIFPDAKMATSQMTPFQSGQYGAPISALLASNADVIQSSYWGGDVSGLILQGAPRGLFKKSLVVLTAGEPAVQELGAEIPDGTVIGARGPFPMYAPKSELNTWFRKAFEARFKVPPNYESYKMAQAILGVKSAYEKAQAANGGKAPDQDQVIAALEHLTWTGPGGEVSLSRGKGHQAAQGTAYGRIKHVKGKTEFVDVERFTAEQVTPPEGVKSEDWIKSNFMQYALQRA
jgi:branched-chain amino acid transport system substrate-binding protein